MLHQIEIRLEADGRLRAEPERARASLGDLLEWSSKDGDATLLFEADHTPFATATVRSGTPYEVLRRGTFAYRCTLKPKCGEELGWRDHDGAEVVIETRGGD